MRLYNSGRVAWVFVEKGLLTGEESVKVMVMLEELGFDLTGTQC